MRRFSAVLAALAVGTTAMVTVPGEAQAATWDPAMVISDKAFYTSGNMTESQIQKFLDEKGKDCKAGGGKSCIKDELFDTANIKPDRGGCAEFKMSGKQKAAKIISEVSKACKLNAQVILATIQKEQSAIERPTTPEAFRKVMGSGCPDTAPCDGAQAGFTRQVYFGADKLVSYKDTSWANFVNDFKAGRASTIGNNPLPGTGTPDPKCGTQTFKIKNVATASLYTYTPWIGGSSAAGCPAIGQRSFFNIMNRYFPKSLGVNPDINVPSTAPATIPAGAYPDLDFPYGENVISGGNRYETAVRVSQKLFPEGATSNHVFVASGEDFPDAVSISALAAHAGGPLLLVKKNSLPAESGAELARLRPQYIWIAGGTGAISAKAESAIQTAVPSAEIVRLAGKSRFETSKLVADRFPVGSPAIVTTGTAFPDALVSAGAVQHLASESSGGAVVLAVNSSLNSFGQQALKRLKPKSAYIVGGSWTEGQRELVRNSAGLSSVDVIAGRDRYETSALVAEKLWGPDPSRAIYATGLNFPDALTTGPLSASADAPILLLHKSCATSSVIQIQPVSRFMVGGSAVLTSGASINWCGR